MADSAEGSRGDRLKAVPSAADSSGDDASGGGAAAAANPTVLPLGPAAQETLRTNTGRAVSAMIVPQTTGRKTKRSWVWQVFSELTPSINGKNVFCAVCRHLLSRKASSRTQHGLADHNKVKHPKAHKALMDSHTTVAEGRANITEAIGTFFRFFVFCFAHFSRWVFRVFAACCCCVESERAGCV